MPRTVLILACACMTAVWTSGLVAADEPARKIAVNASITNDVPVTNAHYQLSIELIKPTLTEAKKEVDAGIAKLRERLEAIPADSLIVQARGLEQGRRYKHVREDEPKFVGYFVERSLSIELKDFALVDRLETIFAESPEFSLSSRSFSNRDQIVLRHEARKSALEAAQRKARSMAAVLNMTIGAPLEISEAGPGNTFARGGDLDLPFRQGSFGGEAKAKGNTITIGAEVYVVFELKPAPPE